jgi:hypothetical protein
MPAIFHAGAIERRAGLRGREADTAPTKRDGRVGGGCGGLWASTTTHTHPARNVPSVEPAQESANGAKAA